MRGTAAPAESLPHEALCGLACVLCHRRLPPTWRAARLLVVAEDASGRTYGLYACIPRCPRPPAYDTSTATLRRVAEALRCLEAR